VTMLVTKKRARPVPAFALRWSIRCVALVYIPPPFSDIVYSCTMGRKRLLTIVVLAIFSMMMGAAIYEIFDIHDPKPFPIDPEFLIMNLGFFLALCLSVVLLTLPSLKRALTSVLGLLFGQIRFTLKSLWAFERSIEISSPPHRPVSMRI